MARIAGVNIPTNKRIEVSLTYIFGIGPTLASKILTVTNIDSDKRTKDLNENELVKLREVIEKDYQVEGALKQQINGDIKRLKEISSYRGTRHAKSLPARGQRTKTNSRTIRGNVRRSAGSGKKKVELK